MGNPVTWFEIYSANPQPLHEFFGRVFGWKLQPLQGADYAVVDTDSGRGIAGGIGKAEGPNQTIFSIEVDDPQAFLDRVEANGGKTVVPVTEGDPVMFAHFADPEGNVVGLFKVAVLTGRIGHVGMGLSASSSAGELRGDDDGRRSGRVQGPLRVA